MRASWGRHLLDHGVTPKALEVHEAELLPATRKMQMTNRSGGGPDAVLQMIEDRCGGQFDRIEDVASHEELAEHAEKYKRIAGFSIDALNALPPDHS